MTDVCDGRHKKFAETVGCGLKIVVVIDVGQHVKRENNLFLKK